MIHLSQESRKTFAFNNLVMNSHFSLYNTSVVSEVIFNGVGMLYAALHLTLTKKLKKFRMGLQAKIIRHCVSFSCNIQEHCSK